ncbi:hypothetical protein GW17_00016733 [Ensete ventricosum]|nr:hypothetical protein GW17_00016733 [Ensete ventricosum]RZR85685.1 hypothetical protein BHM03_00012704 [Ensete ventricosum]
MLSVARYQVRYGSVETKCPLELVEISALPANLTEARSTFDVHLTWRLCDVAKQHDRCGGVIFLLKMVMKVPYSVACTLTHVMVIRVGSSLIHQGAAYATILSSLGGSNGWGNR